MAARAARCLLMLATFPRWSATVVSAATALDHRPARDDAPRLGHEFGVGVQRIAAHRLVAMIAEQAIGILRAERQHNPVQKTEQLGRGRPCVVVQATVYVAQCACGDSGVPTASPVAARSGSMAPRAPHRPRRTR